MCRAFSHNPSYLVWIPACAGMTGLEVTWPIFVIPAQAGIQEKERLTRHPQTTCRPNPSFPRAAPACIRQGAGITEQRHVPPTVLPAGLPPNVLRRGRESTFSAVVTAPPLCDPGALVSPLQDIICSGRCLAVLTLPCHPRDSAGRFFPGPFRHLHHFPAGIPGRLNRIGERKANRPPAFFRFSRHLETVAIDPRHHRGLCIDGL